MLWRVILKSQKCIFEWSKEPIKRFLAIFGILVCCIDLILHIVMALNVFQDLATLPGHEGSFKNLYYAFLNDVKRQKKRFLAIFWSFDHIFKGQKSKNQKSENQKIRKSENRKSDNRNDRKSENQKAWSWVKCSCSTVQFSTTVELRPPFVG